MFVHEYKSPLGRLTLASDGESLTGLWLAGQKYYGATLGKDAVPRRLPVFEATAAWLDEYFQGGAPGAAPPLAPAGSAFRQEVWQILLAIPRGRVTTYGAIARALAARNGKTSFSAQAVGGAVGHNPISVIIPCHRVVGSDGSLTGYAGGVDKKMLLLQLEKADMMDRFEPAV